MAYSESFERAGTHRLIPSEFSKPNALAALPLSSAALEDLTEIEALTNARKVAVLGRNSAIGPSELLSGMPYANIVNAAFCHPGAQGGRFNNSRRGVWYAGIEFESSLSEIAFHKKRFLKNARITASLAFEYVDFLADFAAHFHHLDAAESGTCLQPHPVPQCYLPSQALANSLLYSGSNGIVYPSVRHPSGTCVACFRPALVYRPRRDCDYRITLRADSDEISVETLKVSSS